MSSQYSDGAAPCIVVVAAATTGGYYRARLLQVAAHLHRALLGLHEDEHGWRKALLDDASQREQLALLVRVRVRVRKRVRKRVSVRARASLLGWPGAVDSATVEVAGRRTRGSGWAPSGPATLPGSVKACRAARCVPRRHSGRARAPPRGGAGGLARCPSSRPQKSSRCATVSAAAFLAPTTILTG